MDPVEHRRVKQVCLILTARSVKAFYGFSIHEWIKDLQKKVVTGKNNLRFSNFAISFCCRVFLHLKASPFVLHCSGLSRFIHLSTKQRRTNCANPRWNAQTRTSGTDINWICFSLIQNNECTCVEQNRLGKKKKKKASGASGLNQAPGSQHTCLKKHIRHLYFVTFKMVERKAGMNISLCFSSQIKLGQRWRYKNASVGQ